MDFSVSRNTTNSSDLVLIKPIGLCGTQNAQKKFGPDQQIDELLSCAP